MRNLDFMVSDYPCVDPLIVLVITAWKLDGESLSDTGKTVERAMNLGPTVYPLAFAAIGSRCLRSIAIRLAETETTRATYLIRWYPSVLQR